VRLHTLERIQQSVYEWFDDGPNNEEPNNSRLFIVFYRVATNSNGLGDETYMDRLHAEINKEQNERQRRILRNEMEERMGDTTTPPFPHFVLINAYEARYCMEWNADELRRELDQLKAKLGHRAAGEEEDQEAEVEVEIQAPRKHNRVYQSPLRSTAPSSSFLSQKESSPARAKQAATPPARLIQLPDYVEVHHKACADKALSFSHTLRRLPNPTYRYLPREQRPFIGVDFSLDSHPLSERVTTWWALSPWAQQWLWTLTPAQIRKELMEMLKLTESHSPLLSITFPYSTPTTPPLSITASLPEHRRDTEKNISLVPWETDVRQRFVASLHNEGSLEDEEAAEAYYSDEEKDPFDL
jgi:hypothetical protein